MPLINYPSSDFCFGREGLCRSILEAAIADGAVLLLGGRQSGKTTVLLRLEKVMKVWSWSTQSLGAADLPVYFNLLTLPHDATPNIFFRLLAEAAIRVCKEQIGGFDSDIAMPVYRDDNQFEIFMATIRRLRQASGNLDLRFLFLLDEAKRILGPNFPRGFRDNLFSVLYGPGSISGTCLFVFAGAQELYEFYEEGTSPIGSRAARKLVLNLAKADLKEMVKAGVESISDREAGARAAMVYKETGGHAGLSARLVRKIAAERSRKRPAWRELIAHFESECSGLFEIWLDNLSPEARVIHDILVVEGCLEAKSIPKYLFLKGMDPARSDRAREEVMFTGIGISEGNLLRAANKIYAQKVSTFIVGARGAEQGEAIWALIERVEVCLRQLLRAQLEKRWGSDADDKIKEAVGEQSWLTVMDNRDKWAASYPRSRPGSEAAKIDVLNFTYFGQLIQVMLWRGAWDMFRHLFRDKRELEDMRKIIGTVRNDYAHFRPIPQREIDRCRIACEDLLAIIEEDRSRSHLPSRG